MIPLSDHIGLGLDKDRMTKQSDVDRQTATAQQLLDRLFSASDGKRWEVQLLADEVGMGKTFVGSSPLPTPVLQAMEGPAEVPDLDGCYKKILIITPPNSALFSKWHREVGEFVSRCTHKQIAPTAKEHFRPISVDRLDDLVAAIRRRGGRGARVVVTTMQVFGERKLKDYDLKRRFLLGVIFRYWGNAFNMQARERLPVRIAMGTCPSLVDRSH